MHRSLVQKTVQCSVVQYGKQCSRLFSAVHNNVVCSVLWCIGVFGEVQYKCICSAV